MKGKIIKIYNKKYMHLKFKIDLYRQKSISEFYFMDYTRSNSILIHEIDIDKHNLSEIEKMETILH